MYMCMYNIYTQIDIYIYCVLKVEWRASEIEQKKIKKKILLITLNLIISSRKP